jgi:hypothetical protein
MVSGKAKVKIADTSHCKVVWVCRGCIQTITDMYDKPRRLCLWWIREHKRDGQYAGGNFFIVSVFWDKTS